MSGGSNGEFSEYRRLILSEIERLDRQHGKTLNLLEEMRAEVIRLGVEQNNLHESIKKTSENIEKLSEDLDKKIIKVLEDFKEMTDDISKIEKDSAVSKAKLAGVGAGAGAGMTAIWEIVANFFF